MIWLLVWSLKPRGQPCSSKVIFLRKLTLCPFHPSCIKVDTVFYFDAKDAMDAMVPENTHPQTTEGIFLPLMRTLLNSDGSPVSEPAFSRSESWKLVS